MTCRNLVKSSSGALGRTIKKIMMAHGRNKVEYSEGENKFPVIIQYGQFRKILCLDVNSSTNCFMKQLLRRRGRARWLVDISI